jgi:hypothetical protein
MKASSTFLLDPFNSQREACKAGEQITRNAETAEPAEKKCPGFLCVFCEFCVQRRTFSPWSIT